MTNYQLIDKKEVKRKVIENISNLQYAIDEIKNDAEFVTKLLKDPNVMPQLYKNRYELLEYIGNDLKKNKEFAMSLLKVQNKISYQILEYLDESLLNDKDVMLRAVKCEYQNATYVYHFIGEKLKNDKNFILELIKEKYNYYPLLDEKYKNNLEFSFEIVKNNKSILKYMNKNIRSNDKIISYLRDSSSLYEQYIYATRRKEKKLYYFFERYSTNEIVIHDSFEHLLIRGKKPGEHILDFTLLDHSEEAKIFNEMIEQISFKHQSGYWIISFNLDTYNKISIIESIISKLFDKVKENIHWYYRRLYFEEDELINPPHHPEEITHLFYEENKIVDEYILNTTFDDVAIMHLKEYITNADATNISKDNQNLGKWYDVYNMILERPEKLRDVDEQFKDDRKIVLSAVQKNGHVLECASERLKGDKEVVLEAIKNFGHAFKYASEELKNDEDFVLQAIKIDGVALKYCNAKLRKNKEFVLKAVREKGYAINYVDKTLKNDIDVVKASRFLSFASEDL